MSPRCLAILSVRDEGAFLLDWLSHHRAAGFTDFLVFSNDCSDGTEKMLDRLAALGWLSHVRNDGPHPEGPQWSALKRADRHPAVAAADWIAVIDIDEYVNIHAGEHRIADLLAALPGATAIPLTWRLFGNGGVVRYEDRPVAAQFTRAAPRIMLWPWRAAMFKTLFRNDGTYRKLGVHRPRSPDPDRIASARWFDGSGRELGAEFHRQRLFSDYGQDNYRLAQLNHYALGAMESYLLKCARGRANRDAEEPGMSYWVERNFAVEEDRSIAALAPVSAPIRAELAADPVLGPLHAQAVDWRSARFEALMAEDRFRALFGRLLITPPSRPLNDAAARFMLDHARRAMRARGGQPAVD